MDNSGDQSCDQSFFDKIGRDFDLINYLTVSYTKHSHLSVISIVIEDVIKSLSYGILFHLYLLP